MGNNNQENKFEWIEIVRGAFAGLSCLMIYWGWSKDTNDSFLKSFNLSPESLFLFGIFFSILFLVSSLEKIFSPIVELFLTKLVITLSVTGLLMICMVQSSEMLNKIFSVDASLLPFSRSFLAGILFFKKVYPFSMLLMILMILYYLLQIIDIIKENGKDGWPVYIKYSIFIIPTVACLVFSYKFNNVYFNNKILPKKAYILAKELDFYSNEVCKLSAESKNKKIIYMDTQYKYVLVDKTMSAEQDLWGVIKYASDSGDADASIFYNFDSYEKPDLIVQRCLSDF